VIARLGREPGEQRDRLQHLEGIREEMLTREDRVEPRLAHEPDLVYVLREPQARVVVSRVLRGDEEAVAQREALAPAGVVH
jgi:hypothetical protein